MFGLNRAEVIGRLGTDVTHQSGRQTICPAVFQAIKY